MTNAQANTGSRPDAGCPALAGETTNEGEWITGPVLDNDGMHRHAEEIAAAHGEPARAKRAGPLGGRVSRVRRAIKHAYAILSAGDRPRDPVPAEEWLLDNVHVIEGQLHEVTEDLPRGYLIELPRLQEGALAKYPRVYALCLDYLRHTDARVDPESLVAYVSGYQSRQSLTGGELWAVPTMLRLGLLGVVSDVATRVAVDDAKAKAEAWADRLMTNSTSTQAALAVLERQRITPAFLVELLRILRDRDAAQRALEWIHARVSRFGADAEELGRKVHLRRAGEQVSIANAITSMRVIDSYEWRKFFERTSVIERLLRQDAAYAATDPGCRDRYRSAIERIARRTRLDEQAVTNTAIELARDGASVSRGCVGYYLEHEGLFELQRRCRTPLTFREWLSRLMIEHPAASYFVPAAVLTIALSSSMWVAMVGAGFGLPAACAATLLLSLAASEIALAAVGAGVMGLLPPRLLSRLAFEEGVPAEHRTLVAVPVLFDSQGAVDQLIQALEIRALGNPDPNVHFALIGDFCDARTETTPDDEAIVARAKECIEALNQHSPLASGLPKFCLFHRRRIWNASEGRFMGWERKRGKLEELNRLILGSDPGSTSFSVISAPREFIRSIKYVITLDADTDLPRAAALKLIATLAHPLNRPKWDPDHRRVISGYGIIQPRVGSVPASSRQSRYAQLSTGPSGVDPYTSAVSDVYQDLFGEGSFIGKAIYDVAAFQQATAGRAPENRLLSHDLFEGIFARTALASDIELLDDQPICYAIDAGRTHRWTRGDWQLLPFLAPRTRGADGIVRRNDLPFLGAWKIVDNLRRSLVSPSLVVALVLASIAWRDRAGTVLLFGLLVLATSPALSLFASVLRGVRSPMSRESTWGSAKAGAINVAMRALVLFDQAVSSVDAAARTLFRLAVSHKHLLEWRATGLDRGERSVPMRMWLEVPAVLTVMGVVGAGHGRIDVAAPVLAVWALAPVLLSWWGRPIPTPDPSKKLSDEDRTLFRRTALKTWSFFETFVTEADHWLPPDNFQEEPRPVVAHRTSPTNIGLYLLAVHAARDFGFIGARAVARRLRDTLDTVERLEKREGHVLNWYDTKTGKALEPRYVSTVDSGNLAAYLWTLRHACEELIERPILGTEAAIAVCDALHMGGARAKPGGDDVLDLFARLRGLRALPAKTQEGATAAWCNWAERTRQDWVDEVAALAPHWVPMLDVPAELRSHPGFELARAAIVQASSPAALAESPQIIVDAIREVRESVRTTRERDWLTDLEDRVAAASAACSSLVAELRAIGTTASDLADAMDFAFLFDPDRLLFSVGFNADAGRLDASRYDLLASEARLASFLAIAKNDVPEKHWFHLGRARAQVGWHRALLSWGGSMFEYLMPLLVLKSFPSTLLDQTALAAVEAQRAHANRHGIPWGCSEAAYNVVDMAMTYQYRAFGVPALGLRSGLDEDLVVAPYATALAAMVAPERAASNMRALMREHVEGKHGFYESIDYTASRRPPGRRGVVVKAYMAHHQGMTLVALDNALHGAPMQRRLHADPRVRASELLLEERIPVGTPLREPSTARASAPASGGVDVDAVERIGLEGEGALRAHLLGHGDLATIVTSAGTGLTTWNGLDVWRFREDGRLDPSGLLIYLRNRTTGDEWSAGYEPKRLAPSLYRVTFSVDRVEIHRRDRDVETVTEVVVSPEHSVEIRRISITNHGRLPVLIDLTTYGEVVIAPRAADRAHRAFQNLFVEIDEEAASGALVATRRAHGAGERSVVLAQLLAAETEGWQPTRLESSRADFIGRGGSVAAPQRLWSGTSAAVKRHPLDPAFVLRRSVRIEGRSTARVALVTGIGESRADVLDVIRRHVSSAQVDRVFELASADARVELKHLGIGAAQSFRFQRLLSFVLDPQRGLRAGAEAASSRGDCRSSLWSLGISGDLPIVLVRVDDGVAGALCSEVILAHEFFRLNRYPCDLVFLNEEPDGYQQPAQDGLVALVHASPARANVNKSGGVFVQRSSRLEERDRTALLAAARVVLRSSAGPLGRQLRMAMEEPKARRVSRCKQGRTESVAVDPLLFDNGTGGFSQDGREYVLRAQPPAPWCNVIANEHFGTLVTERGGGFTWSGNSQRHRLSPWSNDPTCDPPAEAIYVRDEEGFVWNAASGSVAHRAGLSTFTGRTRDVQHELVVFVPPDDPVKISRLTLRNRSDSPKRLTVYAYVEWVLGSNREESRLTTVTEWDAASQVIVATNRLVPQVERCSFFRSTARVTSATCDRAEFFGRFGSRALPRGVDGHLSGVSGVGLDPCAVLEVEVEVGPRRALSLSFTLGDGEDRAQAQRIAARYGTEDAVERSLRSTREHWDDLLGVLQVETPDRALDVLVNRWLLYQVVSCRYWGRTGFYQSSGAFGFRDQIQDVLALLVARPDMTRKHILRAASRQFEAGDVQHWWHPEDGGGIRTRCADDMLWLVFATLEYLRVTGDTSILDVNVPFLVGRPIAADQRDSYGTPSEGSQTESLYEHCVRAIETGSTEGPHGIPLIRAGDWNDGFDGVGAAGRGESIWLGWFLGSILREFAAVAADRNEGERARSYLARSEKITQALEAHGWDGAWYRRAYFDDGSPLGSRQSAECTIDSIAQSWAVIAGAGDSRRARQAMDQVMLHLVRERPPMHLLLAPPFDGKGPDPGYVRAYPPGIRENGGQYTHAAVWSVQALAMLGEADRAYDLFCKLNPILHAVDEKGVRRYRVEPYVMSGDVYSAPEHLGSGGWSWYTGAAGWMYRVAVESILGLRLRGDALRVDPCVPSHWAGYTLRLRRGTAAYVIRIEMGDRARTTVDGAVVEGAWLKLRDDGMTHEIRVERARHARLAV